MAESMLTNPGIPTFIQNYSGGKFQRSLYYSYKHYSLFIFVCLPFYISFMGTLESNSTFLKSAGNSSRMYGVHAFFHG